MIVRVTNFQNGDATSTCMLPCAAGCQHKAASSDASTIQRCIARMCGGLQGITCWVSRPTRPYVKRVRLRRCAPMPSPFSLPPNRKVFLRPLNFRLKRTGLSAGRHAATPRSAPVATCRGSARTPAAATVPACRSFLGPAGRFQLQVHMLDERHVLHLHVECSLECLRAKLAPVLQCIFSSHRRAQCLILQPSSCKTNSKAASCFIPLRVHCWCRPRNRDVEGECAGPCLTRGSRRLARSPLHVPSTKQMSRVDRWQVISAKAHPADATGHPVGRSSRTSPHVGGIGAGLEWPCGSALDTMQQDERLNAANRSSVGVSLAGWAERHLADQRKCIRVFMLNVAQLRVCNSCVFEHLGSLGPVEEPPTRLTTSVCGRSVREGHGFEADLQSACEVSLHRASVLAAGAATWRKTPPQITMCSFNSAGFTA